MKRTLVITLLLFAGHLLLAQNYKQEIMNLQEKISRIEKLHAIAEVKMYMTDEATKPVSVKLSTIKKNGDDYHCTMDNVSLVMNSRCMLMVYGDEKQIIYSEGKRKSDTRQLPGPEELSKMISQNDSISYKGITNGCRHYVVHSKGMIRTTHILIDSSTGMIRQLVYHYDPKYTPQVQKVEIDYTLFDTDPEFGNDEFSEKKYIKKSGKTLTGTGKYTGYNVLNYDPEKF